LAFVFVGEKDSNADGAKIFFSFGVTKFLSLYENDVIHETESL